ncbi:fumarylacetoacetate hydrolase, partial [Streptomyces sp. SID11233]|nr:fumarylacetoacetate hydrolase [Streptomyces sp. SID11233]
MRLAHIDGRLVIKAPQGYLDVAAESQGRFGPDPQAVLADWESFADWARGYLASPGAGTATPVATGADAVWGSPVGRPAQIFAVGLNYRDHIA